MISENLNDEDCPKEIREFVRNHEHIRFDCWFDNGYNGIVYFGERIKMQEEVVIKFYLANEEYDSSEEAIILRGIEHRNILRVDDIRFLQPWNTFFLSPKISGGDLKQLIDNNECRSSSRALQFMQGLLTGLSELHSMHGLVHRDLKPANLLFRLEDDSAVIADLGSIKKIDQATGFVTASKSTRLFLPPESLEENRYYFQSDIYQMGIVLYQLLGGYFPVNNPLDFLNTREKTQLDKLKDDSIKWGRKHNELINNKITRGKLLNLQSLPRHLDARFKKVIRTATHIDHTRRYNNVAEFLTEVNKLARDFPDYEYTDEGIFVTHQKGASYWIKQTGSHSYVLDKLMTNGKWRRNNKHDGSLGSILQLVNAG